MTQTPENKWFKGTLRDYQEYCVKWLHFLDKSKFGGILADDMGLGKTIQTLAFSSTHTNNPILIVGPTNVVYNWKKEIT